MPQLILTAMLGIGIGAWALMLGGCGGAGGEAATATPTDTVSTVSNATECYFDLSSGRNMGEVGSEEGEEAAADAEATKSNIGIYTCNSQVSITIDESADITTTTNGQPNTGA